MSLRMWRAVLLWIVFVIATGCAKDDGGSSGQDGGHDSDTVCDSGCAKVWGVIPGGSFQMGSADGVGNADEHPQHSVEVPAFQMLKTEVTLAEYQICVEMGGCTKPGTGGGCNWGVSDRDMHPVNCVDWNQADAFCTWLGARLPSEAEWEYAARNGGKDVTYPWGNDTPTSEHAVYSASGTAPVCSKAAGTTDQGLCDMAGNVYEWVQDWYHDGYEEAPADGSAWEKPSGSSRVKRGGSLMSGEDFLRAASRTGVVPSYSANFLGLRCAKSL